MQRLHYAAHNGDLRQLEAILDGGEFVLLEFKMTLRSESVLIFRDAVGIRFGSHPICAKRSVFLWFWRDWCYPLISVAGTNLM